MFGTNVWPPPLDASTVFVFVDSPRCFSKDLQRRAAPQFSTEALREQMSPVGVNEPSMGLRPIWFGLCSLVCSLVYWYDILLQQCLAARSPQHHECYSWRSTIHGRPCSQKAPQNCRQHWLRSCKAIVKQTSCWLSCAISIHFIRFHTISNVEIVFYPRLQMSSGHSSSWQSSLWFQALAKRVLWWSDSWKSHGPYGP